MSSGQLLFPTKSCEDSCNHITFDFEDLGSKFKTPVAHMVFFIHPCSLEETQKGKIECYRRMAEYTNSVDRKDLVYETKV